MRIKKERQRIGLDIWDAAKYLGLTQSRLNELEGEQDLPSASEKINIERFYKIKFPDVDEISAVYTKENIGDLEVEITNVSKLLEMQQEQFLQTNKKLIKLRGNYAALFVLDDSILKKEGV